MSGPSVQSAAHISEPPPSAFTPLPRETLFHLFSYLDVDSLKALAATQAPMRQEIFGYVNSQELLRNFSRLPAFDMEPSTLDRVERIASKVEMVPVVGYLVSLPRLAGGLVLSIGFGIALGVNRIRASTAETERERRNIAVQEKYCEEQAQRAAWNILKGAANSFPVMGEFAARHNLDSGHFDAIRSYCLRALDGSLKAVRWLQHTQDSVLNHIPALSPELLQRVQAAIAQQATLTQEQEQWSAAYYNGGGMNEMLGHRQHRRRTIEAAREVVDCARAVDAALAGAVSNALNRPGV